MCWAVELHESLNSLDFIVSKLLKGELFFKVLLLAKQRPCFDCCSWQL